MDHFLHFIINKQSRNSDAAFKKLLIELPKYTKNYDFIVTEDLKQLDKVLFKLKKTIDLDDLLIVVGGDGSLNQFVTLYNKYEFSNSIGYIPAGSGNDFARTHKIPTNTHKAIEYLFNVKKEQEISIVQANQNSKEHYAVNSIGVGIDGLINELVASGGLKKKLGPFSYLSVLYSGFTKQNKFSLALTIDEETHQFENVQLALVANNPYFGGGINIIPEANGKDEKLNLLIADNVSLKDLSLIVPKILMNKNHLSHPKLHSFISKKVALSIDSEQYGQKDGEVFHQRAFNYTFQTKKLPFWI